MLPSFPIENSDENPFDSTTKTNSPATLPYFFVQKKVIEEYGAQIGTYGISIYTVLCYLADQSGICSPSVGQLARIIHCSEATVRRALNMLKGYGLLDVVASYNQDGGQRTSQYILRPLDINPKQQLHN